MIYSTYNTIVNEWKIKYPFKPIIQPYNPTADFSCCIRCGSRRKLSRHHKGNDFYFATLRPDLYAARYIQFRPEDIAKLCDRCHKLVHTNYKKMMLQVKHSQPYGLVTQEWCDHWINEFRSWFDKWIQKPYTKRKKRRKPPQVWAKYGA